LELDLHGRGGARQLSRKYSKELENLARTGTYNPRGGKPMASPTTAGPGWSREHLLLHELRNQVSREDRKGTAAKGGLERSRISRLDHVELRAGSRRRPGGRPAIALTDGKAIFEISSILDHEVVVLE
jgi:hypothetical protein